MNNPTVLTALAAFLALDAEQRRQFEAGRSAIMAAIQPSFGLGLSSPATVTPKCVRPVPRPPLPISANPDLFDADLFMSEPYRRMAVGEKVLVYAGGSDGLYALVRDLGTTIYKVGVSSCESVLGRMISLAGDAYASCYTDRAGQILQEEGFAAWRAVSLPLHAERPHGSPVRAIHRGLLVTLPVGYTMRKFDRDLAGALGDRSLSAFATSPEGLERCARIGMPPERLLRLTPRQNNGKLTYMEATELVRIAPRHDADQLADIIETLIATFVMSQPDQT